MTYEEAIEILQEERDYAQSPEYVKEAIKIATSAIEKQMPKKPFLHSFSESHETYTYFKCPNLCDIYCEVKNNMHFCSKCGQALDWSDTES